MARIQPQKAQSGAKRERILMIPFAPSALLHRRIDHFREDF
jgi:hypothetical protein